MDGYVWMERVDVGMEVSDDRGDACRRGSRSGRGEWVWKFVEREWCVRPLTCVQLYDTEELQAIRGLKGCSLMVSLDGW